MIEDDVVVVTGAATGLGAGIVEVLLAKGARVVLGDIKEHALAETARSLDPSGAATHTVVCDVTNEDAVDAMIASAVSAFGRIDGLVNNAGVVVLSPALEEGREPFELQFGVNVTGLFACCKSAARQMLSQGTGGRIVNVASNAGKVGFPEQAGYNASKAAVINLTRTLAAEWAPHRINVNAVCPGSVDTPMLRGVADYMSNRTGISSQDWMDRMVSTQLARHIAPAEVGRVIAFLLSSDADIIRGQSINVDAGATPY
jgi:NAD(P)-dependent dehydrogenase (short-subunit alcohol dehydrogenase family)